MSMRPILAVSVVALALLLGACAGSPKKDLALEQVRSQLERLKEDEQLEGYAPLALGEAERALRQAEMAGGDDTQRLHLIYMADRRIQIARTVAQREQLQAEYDGLETERNNLLVWASQLEAEQARAEAAQARMMSQATAEDAERGKLISQRRQTEQYLDQDRSRTEQSAHDEQ